MTDLAPSKGLTSENQPFWDACARGVLLIKRCIETGKCFYYPREFSPFTGGPTEWTEASGFGEIYSCSVAHRAKPPYCIAYVCLDEGPMMLTNIEAEDLSKIGVGQRVQVVFQDVGDRKAPFFIPVS